MLLAGDIGGTKTNLALFAPETGLAVQAQSTFKSARYDSLEAVVEAFLAENRVEVDRAVFGVAGPIVDGETATTNLPWVIREVDLEQRFGLREVKLLNDLEAAAYGVPHLSSSDLFQLNDVPPQAGTKVVIAPGTGLGEAVLFDQGERYYVIPSEGGHTDFGPTNLLEIRLLRYLMGRFGHISYERICSGPGIPLIYAFLKKQRFAPELPEHIFENPLAVTGGRPATVSLLIPSPFDS